MFFAGIDAHTRYLVVVIINRMGERVLGPTRVPVRRPEQLLTVLAPYRPLDAILETSASWPWLHDCLTGSGVTFVLAHARRLRAIAEANYKRDDIDAELLARMRLAGLIPEVYPTPPSQREWATLVRHRTTLVRQRTMLVNRMHGQLHARGLSVARGHLLTRLGQQWLLDDALPQLGYEQRALVRSHLQILAGLRPLIRALDRHIEAVAATIPQAQLLQTITGIGAHRALVICAEVLPISRFPTSGHLTSYSGLVPRSKQSGERPVRHATIPMAANRWLRGALVRAVVSHARHAPDSWLTQYYRAQTKRLGWPTARVAAARKLMRAIHTMLRTNTRWTNTRNDPARGELEGAHAA